MTGRCRRVSCLRAVACLLRPTSGVLWLFLAAELVVRQIHCLKAKDPSSFKKEGKADEQRAEDQEGSVLPLLELVGEAGSFIGILLTIGLAALGLALAVDTAYDYLEKPSSQRWPTFSRRSASSLSCTRTSFRTSASSTAPTQAFLIDSRPAGAVHHLAASDALRPDHRACKLRPNAVRGRSLGDSARRSLAKLACVTVALYSLLGHKEFRFLQPLLPALTVLAATGLADSYAGNSQSIAGLRQRLAP